MPRLTGFIGWLDSRTGWRSGRETLLAEPIKAGVGWWFVTGSVLLMLLAVQFVTGIVLAMFYVPAPDHAYDSIRFIISSAPGRSALLITKTSAISSRTSPGRMPALSPPPPAVTLKAATELLPEESARSTQSTPSSGRW